MSGHASVEEAVSALRAEIMHPVPLALFDYWNAARGRRSMPARADIDPVTIPPDVLPYVMLIDVIWDAPDTPVNPRLHYRLMGTGVVDTREGLVPLDPTGWYLDRIPHRQGHFPSQLYREVASTGRPGYQTGSYAPDHPRLAGIFHRLAMPLSEDGLRVNMLLAAFCRGPHKG